ncbi:uncharacterized protein LOC108272419 [Ictalurus punctatus]|uniref:Uncharacterized protein LOC108272419 n=1 Tax=Ictalurus punctatus TaxID=7998 RepID=A0A2D0S2A4_ICTPU|nr:uncharacterized protein LOC108272419 [Ictalurus punctatus]
MAQNYSSEVVLKNTAEAVIIPLKNGISSLNGVYEALIKADVDPITGQCSNYNYIRQQIVQAHQHLQRSEQVANSGLKSLDESLERFTEDEGKLECDINDTEKTLDNLRTKQAFNQKLLRECQGSLELARTKLNSTKQILQEQESRKHNAEIVTGVGAGLMVIPFIGWIAGSAMMIGGAVEMDQAENAVSEAEEEERRSYNEVKNYEHKVSDYESKISHTSHDISQKNDKLKMAREGIQEVKKQIQAVADFQSKARRAVQFLGVLSGRASVAEHQTRRFILQEPVMKVMEDVMNAMKEITGNEFLYNKDMMRLIDQMKENNLRLAAICASEKNAVDDY